MYTIQDYNPPKPFFMMSINELITYNNHCKKIDKFLLHKKIKKRKHKRTKNRKNRRTKKKKRKTKKYLSKSEKIKW